MGRAGHARPYRYTNFRLRSSKIHHEVPGFLCHTDRRGSFPHTEPLRLLDRIFRLFPDMPAWPQMPVRDWCESMYVQYSEGLPGAVVDRAAQTIYFRKR